VHSHLLTLELIQLMPNSRLNPQQNSINYCLTDAYIYSTKTPSKFNKTAVTESISTHIHMLAAKALILHISLIPLVTYYSRHYGTKLPVV